MLFIADMLMRSFICFKASNFFYVINTSVPYFVPYQERFYFGDNVLPCFESGIPLLKSRLQQLPDSDNVRVR